MTDCFVDRLDSSDSLARAASDSLPSAASRPRTGTAILVLVRHGETAWNRCRKIQGHLDVGLNATGLAQATATARALADWPVSAVHSSDLARAYQTASAIAEAHDLPVLAEPALRERHWGCFQGMRFDEIARDHPDAGQRIRDRDPEFVPDGGESIVQLDRRVKPVLDRLGDHAAGRTVVVVTHGGVLDAIYRIATGMALSAPRAFPLTNAAINVIERGGSGWRVRCWGEVAHLAAIEQRDEIG